MADRPQLVEDTDGRRYRLGRLLGEGGQGAVYEVEGGRLAVKWIGKAQPPDAREELRQRLAEVRRYPLDDVPIARPLEMLRPPDVGYVMELLADLEEIGRIVKPSASESSVKGWYLATGGLRRRLRILGRCADAVAQLHGKGLVFGDLSPTNVLVSTSPEHDEVYLIDPDNLRCVSSPSRAGIWSRGYGAPEILAGKGSLNTLTDAYSFAVLAFRTLALVHPLIGDPVEDGEPELEERAFEGQLPWIDHPTDGSNRSSRGIPREYVLSPRLCELAQKTFGEGLQTPEQRPGLAEWAERLHTAADHTVTCANCGGQYYRTCEKCPWCEEPRGDYALASLYLCERGQGATDAWRSGVAYHAISQSEDTIVTDRLINGYVDAGSHRPRLALRFDGHRMTARSLDGQAYRLVYPATGSYELVGDQPRAFRLDRYLDLGERGPRYHLLRFAAIRGSAQ